MVRHEPPAIMEFKDIGDVELPANFHIDGERGDPSHAG